MYTMIASAIFSLCQARRCHGAAAPVTPPEPAAIVPARAIQQKDHAELDAPGAGPHGGGRPLSGRPDRGRRDMLHKTQVSQGSNQPVHESSHHLLRRLISMYRTMACSGNYDGRSYQICTKCFYRCSEWTFHLIV